MKANDIIKIAVIHETSAEFELISISAAEMNKRVLEFVLANDEDDYEDEDVERYLFDVLGYSWSNTTYRVVNSVRISGGYEDAQDCVADGALRSIREFLKSCDSHEFRFVDEGFNPYVSYIGDFTDGNAVEIQVNAVMLDESQSVCIEFLFCDYDMNNEESYREVLVDAVRRCDWATIAASMGL